MKDKRSTEFLYYHDLTTIVEFINYKFIWPLGFNRFWQIAKAIDSLKSHHSNVIYIDYIYKRLLVLCAKDISRLAWDHLDLSWYLGQPFIEPQSDLANP